MTSSLAIRQYDNVGAYKALQALMNRGENLTIKFFTSKDNIPCAWIESRNVAGFKYEMKNESFHGIINYLRDGIPVDFDNNPSESTPLDEKTEFPTEVLKMFVNAGMTLQYTPLFRTQSNFLSAVLPLAKGKILFKVERTEELLDYLRENKQVII